MGGGWATLHIVPARGIAVSEKEEKESSVYACVICLCYRHIVDLTGICESTSFNACPYCN